MTKLLKRTTALLLALACIALAACQKAEEQGAPSQTQPSNRADGRVYAESAVDLGDISAVQELRTAADGTLAGIGFDYSNNEYAFFKIDTDGKVTKTSKKIDDNNAGNFHRLYNIDYKGDIYVYEVDMSKYWGGNERPLPAEAIDEAAASEEAPSADTKQAKKTAKPKETPAPTPEPTPVPADSIPTVRQFDSAGNELKMVKLPEVEIQGEGENMYPDLPNRFDIDSGAGLIYVLTNSKLQLYDLNSGELKKSVPTQNGMYDLSIMTGGYMLTTNYEDTGLQLRCWNPMTGEEKWSKTITGYPESLKYNASDNKIYGRMGRKIVSFDENGNEGVLLELSDFSVLSPFYWLRNITIGKDDTVFCVVSEQSNREKYIVEREQMLDEMERRIKANPESDIDDLYSKYNTGSDKSKLIRLALTDPANVPPVTEITVSVMYEDYSLMSMASAFRASHPDIRIKIKEMIPQEEINKQGVDYNALIQRVNTEIISGKAADVLLLDGLPYQSYGKKNILEDLLPLMENDPEFNMGDYRQNIFGAFKLNGKLYALPTGFTTQTFMSKKGVFIKPELTTADFFEKLFALKNTEVPMQYARDASSLYYTLLYANIPQFQDANGNIMLDSPEFIAFLENIKKADELYKNRPQDEGEGDIMYGGVSVTRAYSSSAVAMPAPNPDEPQFTMDFGSLYGYYAATSWKQQYGKDVELRYIPSIRLPNIKGFMSSSVYGINRSSKNKDAAWQFLKFLVSEQLQSSDYYGYGMPVNLKASRKLAGLTLREANNDRRQFELDNMRSSAAQSEATEKDPYYEQYISNLFSQEDADMIDKMAGEVDTLLSYDTTVITMANEELEPYLKGQKSAAETAKTLQSRLSMYLSEQG